jgi:hypothetical protein
MTLRLCPGIETALIGLVARPEAVAALKLGIASF